MSLPPFFQQGLGKKRQTNVRAQQWVGALGNAVCWSGMVIVLTNSRLLKLLLQYQAQFNMNGGGTFKVSHVNEELVTVHRFWEWE